MADVALISTLERNVSFFASRSMLILAALLTSIASSDKIAEVLMQVMPWVDHRDGLLQFKLLFLGGRAIVTEGDKYVVKGKRGRPSKIKHSLQISSTFEQVNKVEITFSSPPKIS